MSSGATSVKPALIQSLGMKPSFLWTAHHSVSLPLFGTPFLCLGLTWQYMDHFPLEYELLLWGSSEVTIMSGGLGGEDRNEFKSQSCHSLAMGPWSVDPIL